MTAAELTVRQPLRTHQFANLARSLRARARLASALVLLTFVVCHLLSHITLIVSIPLADGVLGTLMAFWWSKTGGAVLAVERARAVWSGISAPASSCRSGRAADAGGSPPSSSARSRSARWPTCRPSVFRRSEGEESPCRQGSLRKKRRRAPRSRRCDRAGQCKFIWPWRFGLVGR